MNKSWTVESPIFTFIKKHNCPYCKERLIPKKIIRVVDADSKEAKEYDFSHGDSFFIGEVEFHFFRHCVKIT
jgi:hypothetical protein